jgi:hypothetical protein
VIRSLTTSALAVVLVAGTTAQAAEFSFTGSVDAGYAVGLNTFENTPMSGYNLEANLGLETKISDEVSAHLYATSLTGGVGVPGDFGPGVNPDGSYANRWPGFAFDGVDVTWKLGEDMTLVFGDIVVAKGSISYYLAKRYSAVTRVSAVRGLSFSTGGLSVFGGADDVSDSLFTVGGSYNFAIDSSSSIEPAATLHVGGKDNLSWGGGLQYKAKFGEVGLAASGAVFGGKNSVGDDAVGYAITVEPSYTTDAFYVSGFAFFSPTGDDSTHTIFSYPVRHGRTYNPWAEDLTIYVEPGVNFAGGKAAFGLPVEYHEYNLDVDENERIAVVPSLYLYPAKDVTITPWGEVDFYTEQDSDPTYALGLEVFYKF